MYECDLAGIWDTREHAFAKKCATERNSVEAADKAASRPRLDTVRNAGIIELNDGVLNGRVDPGLLALVDVRRAFGDALAENRVATDLKLVALYRALQSLWQVKAVDR